MPAQEPQSARSVLMVRPASFAYNPQTAATNAFQRSGAGPAAVAATALAEFDAAAALLERHGVGVIVVPDSAEPAKPDAIFPNNWVSFHADGSVVLYPMMAPNRRLERRDELLAAVVDRGGFRVSRTIDLSGHEQRGEFLEGTGSLVLDRAGHVAYACLSPRTHLAVLGDFAQRLDYELLAFDAGDPPGQAIYHTNVMMSVGGGFAVVCAEAIGAEEQRRAVLARLAGSGRQVIEITVPQMRSFAGNILELAGKDGPVVAISTTAWRALDDGRRRILERHAAIACADIPTIEQCGGGGIRCMLAEVHLPRREERP